MNLNSSKITRNMLFFVNIFNFFLNFLLLPKNTTFFSIFLNSIEMKLLKNLPFIPRCLSLISFHIIWTNIVAICHQMQFNVIGFRAGFHCNITNITFLSNSWTLSKDYSPHLHGEEMTGESGVMCGKYVWIIHYGETAQLVLL